MSRKTQETEPLSQSESDKLDTGLQAVTLRRFRNHWRRAFPGLPVPKVFGESYREPIAIPSQVDRAMLCKMFHCEPSALKKMTLSEITDRLEGYSAATTQRQPTERGPVPFPECLNPDGTAKRLNCYVCHEAVKAGEMVYFIGLRPGSGALYRRHVTCARMPQKPKSDVQAVEPGGKAGPAANGRVVRSTRTFGG